jgi:hypothetical protein
MSHLKRSILFGALGCIWAALAVIVTFTDSLTDFPSIYDQAYHMADYRVISAAWFVFEAVGLNVATGLAFLVTLLTWLGLLRVFGFIGKRWTRPRRGFLEWLHAMGGIFGVMSRCGLVIISVFALGFASGYGSSFLALDIMPFYSIGFVNGLFVWTLFEAGPSVFLAFAMFSLFHAVFANDRPIHVLKSLSIPAMGIAAFFMATGAAYLAADSMDVFGTLADAPGITSGETHDTLYALADEPVEYTVGQGFPELLLTSPRFGDEVPFTMSFCADNESVVCRYLLDGGMPSVQTATAHDYVFAYRIRRLDMPGLMDTLVAAWESTGEPVYWNLCLTWITRGAKSDERLVMLRSITDESRYNIPGRSAMKVSAAYAKYGEMDRARYWYGKGTSTGRNFSEKDMLVYEPGENPVFGTGVIRGRVAVADNIGVSGVGILPAASMDVYPHIDSDISRTVFLTMSITDGVTLGPDGSFEFAGLPAGEYLIMLSVPGDGGHTVINPPGVIFISEGNPVADVGTIGLERVVGFPDAVHY